MGNLDITMLDHYGFQNGLNNGMTMGDLCGKYGCSEGDAEHQIGKLYGNNRQTVKKYLNQLERNAKKAKKSKTPKEPAEEVPATETVLVEEPITTIAESTEELVEEPEITWVASEILAKLTKDRDDEQQKLARSIKLKGQEVSDSKADAKSAKNKLCVLDRRLRTQAKRLDELNDQFVKEYADFLNTVSEREAVAQHLDDCCLKVSDGEAALDELSRKATDNNTLVVFAYSDGRIVIVDEDKELLISEVDNSSSKYNDLLNMPECENLRLKDIKTLAKLLVLKDISGPFVIDPAFDNDELAEVYLSLA